MKQALKQLKDISGKKLLGNPNDVTGNIQEVEMGAGLTFSSGTVSVKVGLDDVSDVTTNLPNNPTQADDGKILFYDSELNNWTSDDTVTHGTVIINGKKSTAGSISKGTPVYLVGFDNDIHTVEVANANSSTTMPVIGLAAEDLDNTNSKHIITFGKLTGVDTSSFSQNDVLYVDTTNGGLTTTRPTGSGSQIQRIAKVLKVGTTDGQMLVFNTARTAGLPNLATDNVWVGDSNGIPQSVDKNTLFPNSYGEISINDSTGNPTFYNDLQSAIDNTSDIDTLYIHSDIELTSVVTIPERTSITINLQGNRIWGDTTNGDFNLFTLASTSVGRSVHFIGGGIIETIGTASSPIDAATFNWVSTGSGYKKLFFNDVEIKSVNACPIYTDDVNCFEGGYFYSENSYVYISSTSALIKNVFVDTYETSTLNGRTENCTLITRYGGFTFPSGSQTTMCYLYGSATKSGNTGLTYLYNGTNFYNNYLECDSTSTRPTLFVRGSSGTNGRIENNTVINLGSNIAGYWVYGSGYNNRCYAENNQAINAGNNVQNMIKNTAVTNSSDHQAMVSLSKLTKDNTAINLDETNTKEALLVGRSDSTVNEIYGNYSKVANDSAYNMKLNNTGTLYLVNNVMGLIGQGLDLNGNTNAMSNTPDPYGNVKIG